MQRRRKGSGRLRVRGLSPELLFGGLWYFLPLPLFYTQRRYKEYTQHGLRKEERCWCEMFHVQRAGRSPSVECMAIHEVSSQPDWRKDIREIIQRQESGAHI
ncbi:hypothetical protein VIGAN_06005600 [Vigna angularis var. angularis]|uniref:Uncharacterized protein n=1 Tax=Vigna angularis var. angularis TaxID=157739 RepID=A0A0S3S8M0_PHAAN|nr:hypothetical protein VIGAN_06005600 [Vigna angularis var. angularis]